MQALAVIRSRYGRYWPLLARLIWLAISLAALGLLVLTLVTNAVGWWQSSSATCRDAACLADNQALLQGFGSYQAIGLYFSFGAAIEMLPWVLVGALIFWRRSNDAFAWFFSLDLVLFGVLVIDEVVRAIVESQYPALLPLWAWLYFLAGVLIIVWFRFPTGQFEPKPIRWVAVIWVALQLGGFFLPGTPLDFNGWPGPAWLIIRIGFTLSLAFSLIYRYWRSAGPIEQQQIKWIVVSGSFFAANYIFGIFLWPWQAAHPGISNLYARGLYLPVYYLSSALFAASIGIAILRYRLWDIDVVIRRTLIYSTLSGLLVLVYFLSVLVLGGLVRSITGQEQNQLVIVLSTLAIAALFVPLRGGVQSFIDRRFFRRKYDAIRILAAFGAGVRSEVELDRLSQQLLGVVDDTLEPAHVGVWLRPLARRQTAED